MALVIAATTIWLVISLGFILNALQGPRHLIQTGLAILCFEFVFLVIASSSAQCTGGPCVGGEGLRQASGLPRTILLYVIPGLAAAFTLYLIAYGLRRHRASGT